MKDQTEFTDYEINELNDRFNGKVSFNLNGSACIEFISKGSLGTIEWPDLLFIFEFCQNSLKFLHFDVFSRESDPGYVYVEIYEV